MGKTNTSTSQTTVPSQVLQQYQNVNAGAQQAASTPFTPYSSDPNAFVAPLNATENAGIDQTNAYANAAQPYYTAATGTLGSAQNSATNAYNAAGQTISGIGNTVAQSSPYNSAATGLAAAGAQAVDPSTLDAGAINQYMNPYLSTVLGSTQGLLQQDNAQAMNGTLGNIISSGGFGGDRAGIAAANLQQQQTLANANVYSGIASNAYNSALGAAEGQQSLGLSAAQANRAALQNASTQIQGIGNQVYNQGTGAEQLQYNQQTGLGQAEYTTGANTANELASLGTGAQSAGLAGAQAQLAAGQTAQQTQQAGDTALYNQYLMQQSYPFQVAQFLANVAEGTGSLSGQTTTTTQPGSLFSDERLKENKKLVGFTFDNQPIFAYNYKGDHTTHMGLMAQDVEKKHPGAVGESHGFKTVNYDEATHDAAERGHYKKGGLVAYRGYAYGGASTGGFDPGLAAAMAQRASGMYGPYAAGGQGAAASGTGPYGGAARVPQASLAVGHLQAPHAAPQQQSGLAAAANDAKSVDSLVSNVTKGANWVQNKLPANDPNGSDWASGPPSDIGSDMSDLPPMWRGGRTRRAAGGGMPYSGGLALDIPDDDDGQHYQLPNQNASAAKASSTMGDASNIASTVASAAKVAAMFMNRGGLARASGGFTAGFLPSDDDQVGIIGSKKNQDLDPITLLARGGLAEARRGYDTGGAPDDTDSGWGALTPLADVVGGFAKNVGDSYSAAMHPGDKPKALGDTDTSDTSKSAPNLIDPKTAKTPDELKSIYMHNAVQSAKSPDDLEPIYKAEQSSTSPSHSGARHSSGLSAASDPWAGGTPATVAGPISTTPDAQVMGADGNPAAGPSVAAPAPAGLALNTTPQTPDMTGNAGGNAPAGNSGAPVDHKAVLNDIVNKVAPQGSYLDKLFHGDKMAVLPFLSALGAATGARTSNGFTAIAQGLSAGANTYQNLQTQQADLAQKAANTAQTEEATQGAVQHQYGNENTTMVPGAASDPTKTIMVAGHPYHAVPRGTMLDTGAGGGATQGPGYQSFMRYQGLDPASRTAETQKNMDVLQDGADASQGRLGTNKYATAFVTGDKSLMAPSAIAPLIQKPLSIYNALAGKVGAPQLDPAGQTNAEILNKMSGQIAFLQTHGADQKSLGALETAIRTTPTPGMNRDAGISMLADQYITNQVKADKAQTAQQFDPNKDTPLAGQYRSADLAQNFATAHPTEDYERDRLSLRKAMSSPNWPTMMKAVESGDPKQQQAAKDWLNRFGSPNLHRYVVGNQ